MFYIFSPNLFFAIPFIVTNKQRSSFSQLAFHSNDSEKKKKKKKKLKILQFYLIKITQIIYGCNFKDSDFLLKRIRDFPQETNFLCKNLEQNSNSQQ